MTVPRTTTRRNRQRGMVLMTMAICAIALIGVMGLAVDLGHIFIVKNETQSYVDAAALAAALQMDGTSAGLTRANNAATSLSAAWNFSSTTLTSPTVEYAAAATGTWYTSANVPDPSTVIYARVTKTVAPNIYFVPMVMPTPVYTQNVQSQAIAGQVPFDSNTVIGNGLGPFTGVAACSGSVSSCEDTASSNFGLTVGNEYDIQWPQFNNTRKNCGNGNGKNISNCFNAPPCDGDVTINNGNGNANPMQEVVDNWGSKTNGYWGSTGTSTLNAYILDIQQLAALQKGTDITPDLSSGNKQGTANILDDRVNQDSHNYDATTATTSALKLSNYFSSAHNGRRLMPLPMVYPNPTGTQVVGYGVYLLESDQTSTGNTSGYYAGTNGNQPYCAIYAGPWVLGSTNGGVASAGGGGRVRLVQ